MGEVGLWGRYRKVLGGSDIVWVGEQRGCIRSEREEGKKRFRLLNLYFFNLIINIVCDKL